MTRWVFPLMVGFGCLAVASVAQEPQAQEPKGQEPQGGEPQGRPAAQPPALRDFEPFPSRWFAPGRPVGGVEPPDYIVNEPAAWWNPYRQNELKGDFPILGTEDLFFSLTATNRLFYERRDVPTPSGITGPGPVNPNNFGDGRQTFIQDDFALTFDLFRGQQAFRPVDWRIRITPVFNYTRLDVNEVGVVVIDPAQGTTRNRGDVTLQEAFVEYHLFDLSDRYDFASVEAGVLPFRSDFRGFLFEDTNLGIRFFGNADQNKWQFNLAAFDELDKDTNSQLNRYEDRDQNVFIANIYRQDWPVKGYTTSLSFHYNRDRRAVEFDDNGFLVAPAPIGNFTPNKLDAYYFGWAGEGHLGRWNITHQLYRAFGSEEQNAIAARPIDIEARFAAAELSYDIDWWRPRVFALYASGDSDPRDGKGKGFDSIVDNPNFGGGSFSFWNSQGLKFVGTNLTNPGSPLADLKTSKTQGQSNFVNPGVLLIGGAVDAELAPKWRAQVGATYLRFDKTESLEFLLQAADISKSIGTEVFFGTQYRPLLTNNVIVQFGASALIPDEGFARIYDSNDMRYSFFTALITTW
ncbi:MAG TPA: hypothetical protein VFZ65_15725 [Planctomycetota bacterium]|nr:hypothetical protein [Planctomycetota bacterium]